MIWNPDLQYAESSCVVSDYPIGGIRPEDRRPVISPTGPTCPKCRKGRLVSLAALATSRRCERQTFLGPPGARNCCPETRVISLFSKTSGLLPAQRPMDMPLAAVPRRYDRTRHAGVCRRAALVAGVEVCRVGFTVGSLCRSNEVVQPMLDTDNSASAPCQSLFRRENFEIANQKLIS